MADDAKDAADTEKQPAAPKKRGWLLWVIIGVVVVAAGAGGAIFFLRGGDDAPQTEEAAEAPEHEEKAEKSKKSEKPNHAAAKSDEQKGGEPEAASAVFDMDPFVVNLADTPEIRYLKVSIKFELANTDAGNLITAKLPQIRDSLLILLSSKVHNEIRTVEGKMDLREEMIARVNTVLRANLVKAVYFTDFVVQ